MDERRRLGLERDAAGRELGVIEDAAELVVELAGGAEHVVGMGGARRGVVRPVLEQLGEADDAVQRRPGLVLEERQEALAQIGGAPGFVAGSADIASPSTRPRSSTPS